MERKRKIATACRKKWADPQKFMKGLKSEIDKTISKKNLMKCKKLAQHFYVRDFGLPSYSAERRRWGPNVHKVVKDVIGPCTQLENVSYSIKVQHMVGPREAIATRHRKKVKVFMVSHAWKEKFVTCVSDVLEYTTDVPYAEYWICIMANPQNWKRDDLNDLLDADTNLEHGPFSAAVQMADNCIIVKNEDCDIYSRLWCYFELALMLALQREENKAEDFIRWTGKGPSDPPNRRGMLLEHAQCSEDGDRKKISKWLNKIETNWTQSVTFTEVIREKMKAIDVSGLCPHDSLTGFEIR